MPRYYFHTNDRDYGRDQYGTELPDLMAARCQAIMFAGRVIAENPENVATGEAWSMEVTDHKGLILFHLDFSVAALPSEDEALKATSTHDALHRIVDRHRRSS